MPAKAKAKKEAPAPAVEKPQKEAKAREVPSELTFMDDKRAQYVRLIITNYVKSNAKQYGVKADEVDVETITPALLLKAGKDLVGGTLLNGPEGIDFIMEYTANGSTTGRGLTRAYASEVRPFLRRLQVAKHFGRRGGLSEEEKTKRDAAKAEARAKKEADATKRREERERKSAEAKAKKEAEAKKKAESDKKKAAASEPSEEQIAAAAKKNK